MSFEKKKIAERPQSITSLESERKIGMSTDKRTEEKIETTTDEGDRNSDLSYLESQPQLKRTLKARHLAVGKFINHHDIVTHLRS